jgi:hypothetical protein
VWCNVLLKLKGAAALVQHVIAVSAYEACAQCLQACAQLREDVLQGLKGTGAQDCRDPTVVMTSLSAHMCA